MAEQSVVHNYHHMAEAEDAVNRLIEQKFPADRISIVTKNIETEKQVHGYITTGEIAKEGAGTGAWMGGLFGLLIGAAFLWIPGVGPLVVAGPFAAAVYNARILLRNLEDHPGNFTRFLVIRRDRAARPGPACDKTSIVFATKNIPGALFRCLAAFALRDINLTKLESRPWHGRPFEYLFYLDFIGRPDRAPGREALAQLGEYTSSVRLLGCYPRHR